MNLMLTAKCNNVDEFKKNGYDVVKKEFDSWCDNSKSIFAKIDDNHLVELFFDVNPMELKKWLAKESTQNIFKTHGFSPIRYTFEELAM